MQQNIIKELLVRLSSASPTLFKKLQTVFFTLAAIVIILIFLAPMNIDLHGFGVYVNWNTVLTLLGFAGISMLPVSDSNVLSKKTNDDGVGGSSGNDEPRPKNQ